MLAANSIAVLQKALDAATLRQDVYANNIANADTPGFKRSSVDFESALSQALGTSDNALQGLRTDPRHFVIGAPDSIAAVQPTVVVDKTTGLTNNGNNVDIDAEMASEAKNQLTYDALVQQLNMQFSMLKSVIAGGA